MTSAQVVKATITDNSCFQNYSHLDELVSKLLVHFYRPVMVSQLNIAVVTPNLCRSPCSYVVWHIFVCMAGMVSHATQLVWRKYHPWSPQASERSQRPVLFRPRPFCSAARERVHSPSDCAHAENSKRDRLHYVMAADTCQSKSKFHQFFLFIPGTKQTYDLKLNCKPS